MTKSEIFTAAHRAARILAEGTTYRAAFAMALRVAYRSAARTAAHAVAVAAPVVRTAAQKLDALANVVIQWPSSLRGTFAFRFITGNADRVVRYGEQTKFSDKQVAIIDEMFARYC